MTEQAMTTAEAKRVLESRMRRRFDGNRQGWTVADAHATRLLLSYVRQLEAKVNSISRAA